MFLGWLVAECPSKYHLEIPMQLSGDIEEKAIGFMESGR